MRGICYLVCTTFLSSPLLSQAACGIPEQKNLSPVPLSNSNSLAAILFKRECGNAMEKLTWWNQGEEFPSFGIGHFIWYPKNKRQRFEEQFPELLSFLKEKGISPPVWIDLKQGCPWKTRDHFFKEIKTQKLQELRCFLWETRILQAEFIKERFEKKLADALLGQDQSLREKTLLFLRDAKTLFALIDYAHFKGWGTSPTEQYKGEGWGLLDVLRGMKEPSSLESFINSAKTVLKRRIANAPPERREERWLEGWLKRVDSYRDALP